ncbi:MAG: cell division protein FtsA [Lentisphaeria bacterium]|nr:cell division protein FtsA [Lentisphaeria bacterium]
MFKQHNIITAVELGTDKVCVLIGEYAGEELNIIGKGVVPSGGAVVKGEIVSMDLMVEKLNEALDTADIQSGHELNNSTMFTIAVTNCDMDSLLGEGTAFVQNEEHRIGEEEIYEAVSNAKVQSLNVDRRWVNSLDAYFMIDGVRRSSQPLNQRANILKAYSHIIHGNSNRLENFSAILLDAGLEYEPEMIFSPIADMFGVLSDDELESGTLLVDIGAGTTEYAVVFQNGVLASGVIAIGFEHVANDIAVGLNLPINFCRKILTDGTLEKQTCTGENLHLECRTNSGSMRRVPVASFNRIADERLREIFDLLRGKLCKESFWNNLGSGAVLTGGGAKYFKTRDIFHQVCDLPSRIGKPYSAINAIPPELDDPCYGTIYGVLRYGHLLALQYESRRKDSFGGNIRDKISGFGDAFARTFKNLRNNMKI